MPFVRKARLSTVITLDFQIAKDYLISTWVLYFARRVTTHFQYRPYTVNTGTVRRLSHDSHRMHDFYFYRSVTASRRMIFEIVGY